MVYMVVAFTGNYKSDGTIIIVNENKYFLEVLVQCNKILKHLAHKYLNSLEGIINTVHT